MYGGCISNYTSRVSRSIDTATALFLFVQPLLAETVSHQMSSCSAITIFQSPLSHVHWGVNWSCRSCNLDVLVRLDTYNVSSCGFLWWSLLSIKTYIIWWGVLGTLICGYKDKIWNVVRNPAGLPRSKFCCKVHDLMSLNQSFKKRFHVPAKLLSSCTCEKDGQPNDTYYMKLSQATSMYVHVCIHLHVFCII